MLERTLRAVRSPFCVTSAFFLAAAGVAGCDAPLDAHESELALSESELSEHEQGGSTPEGLKGDDVLLAEGTPRLAAQQVPFDDGNTGTWSGSTGGASNTGGGSFSGSSTEWSNGVSPSLPAYAYPLLGKYAFRASAFSLNVLSITAGHQLGFAEFVEGPNGVEMRMKVCSQRASGLGSTTVLRNPDAYPMLTRKIYFENGGWGSQPSTDGIGFFREGLSECIGRTGQQVLKRGYMTWLSGETCRCAGPGDIPRPDDCRVNDPDFDGAPGLAFEWQGGSMEGKVWHAAVVIRNRYVSGRIDPNGNHTALLDADEAMFLQACERTNPCSSGEPARSCTSDYNPVQFTRLPAGQWSCSMLRTEESRLFSRPRAETPRTCRTRAVTNAP